MRLTETRITITFAALLVAFSSLLFGADKVSIYTGKVSDAMCGAQHMEPGITAADCTRACVAKGSKYALIVGDKVYTLDGESQAALGQLDKLADKNAKVSGIANGDAIQVSTVAPAK